MTDEELAAQRRSMSEAAQARKAAEIRFNSVHARWPVVNDVSRRVRSIRTENHLAEHIGAGFRL